MLILPNVNFFNDNFLVFPVSAKQGHWERKVGESVPNVRKSGTMGTKSGVKCAQRPENGDDGNT